MFFRVLIIIGCLRIYYLLKLREGNIKQGQTSSAYINFIRNMCAHSGRLYYSVFSSIPAGIPQLDINSERRLFGAVMAMRELYPKIDKWNMEILTSISVLNEQYMDVIDLKHIGFPENWAAVLELHHST